MMDAPLKPLSVMSMNTPLAKAGHGAKTNLKRGHM